jgi:DNA-binding CsgD family transcriptional regulator
MKRIEDYISLLDTAKSTQEIFDRFSQVMHNYGYDKVSYGCATDCPSLGLQKRHGHISNFDAGWLKHYAENSLSEIDPVHVHALKKRTPAYWSKCEQNAPTNAIQLMRNAADVGLKSGVIIPLSEGLREVSMVSLARNEKPEEETYETLAAVNLLSGYFYQGYKSFLKKPVPVELSSREYEVLNWAAGGKTDAEIAVIVNISAPTVRYHWNNIFKKLDAYNRVYAVSKAVQMNLVTPYNIGNVQ